MIRGLFRFWPPMPIKFDVVAYFSPPVNGRTRAHTREPRAEGVYAETPASAARMWLWRLSEAERQATVRLVVFPPRPKPVIQTYQGPEVRFERKVGHLLEIADD